MGKCLSTLAEVAAEEAAAPPTVASQAPGQPKFRLSSVNPDAVPTIPYKNELIRVKICEVHDGDTLHVILALGDFPLKISIRVLGIDTPELRGGKDKLPQEKVAGIRTRDHVRFLLGEYTKVKLVDWDKFGGRMLGEVYLANGETLASVLVAQGYAKDYHGEKKQPWTLEELTTGPFAGISRELPPSDD